jgi:hypothetical protein
MDNTPFIKISVSLVPGSLHDAFEAIGIADPGEEDIQRLTHRLQDAIDRAVVETWEQWKREQGQHIE